MTTNPHDHLVLPAKQIINGDTICTGLPRSNPNVLKDGVGRAIRAAVLAVCSISAFAADYQFKESGSLKGGFDIQVATIPKGAEDVAIFSKSVKNRDSADHDLILWSDDELIVGPDGEIYSTRSVKRTYRRDKFIYSGCDGIGGKIGRESITIAGPTRRTYYVGVLAREAGDYQVSLSYDGGQDVEIDYSSALAEKMINSCTDKDGKTTTRECKEFLANVFNAEGKSYRLPSGEKPIMPLNSEPQWRWVTDKASGFEPVASLAPSNDSKELRLARAKAFLSQAKRGWVMQCIWKTSARSQIIQHTVLFTSDYQQGANLEWVASNESKSSSGKPIVTAGTKTGWGAKKTLDDVAAWLSNDPACGARFYKIRADIVGK